MTTTKTETSTPTNEPIVFDYGKLKVVFAIVRGGVGIVWQGKRKTALLTDEEFGRLQTWWAQRNVEFKQ
jgi:hypothetical protein